MYNNDFLGTEKIRKLIYKLALPTVVAQVVNLLYNIVDRIYIGHIPTVGSLALTGVGVCMPIIMLISAFAFLIGSGGAPRASISMGAGDDETAQKIMGNCFSMLMIFSVVLTVVFAVFNRQMLGVFGASENTIGYATDYMTVYALGTVFVQLALGLNVFITAQGFTKISMFSVLIGAVLNIALDPLFIFTFGMGVQGAALATVISQAASCAFIIFFLSSKHSRLRLRLSNLVLKVKIIMPCLMLGISPFIMQATESVLFVCFNSSLLKYGGDLAVGAMTILSSIMSFCMMPLQGFTQGVQPIISYNYGARKPERIKQAFKYTIIICCAYTFCLWAAVELFPTVFARMFTDNAELVEYTKTPLRVYMAVSCMFGAQIGCQQTLIAIGNAKISFFLAVLRKIILLIPLIYLLPALLPVKTIAVYLAEPVADFLAVSTTVTLFTVYFRKAMRALKIDKNEQNTPN